MQKYKTVAELLRDPKRWCKGHYAVDAGGDTCAVDDPKAAKWCLVGACERVYGRLHCGLAVGKLRNALNCATIGGGSSPACFNDLPTTTYEDIMAVVEKAGV